VFQKKKKTKKKRNDFGVFWGVIWGCLAINMTLIGVLIDIDI
jgi:hypothetical protein